MGTPPPFSLTPPPLFFAVTGLQIKYLLSQKLKQISTGSVWEVYGFLKGRMVQMWPKGAFLPSYPLNTDVMDRAASAI